ncbi:hypothetical protein Mapa_004755 [Marchantia paleacea]|nr:hypothetical protein Mapa_004755 [Marchantia paleacea]
MAATAAAMPVLQLYSLSFCSGPKALVHCQQRIHLKGFSSAASSPTDVLSCSGRATRQYGLTGSLPGKLPLCYKSCGRWQGDTRCTSKLGMAAKVQNVKTTVTKAKVGELDERDGGRKLVANVCRCEMCGRRGLIAAVMGGFVTSKSDKAAGALDVVNSDYNKIIETVHPSRGAWYEEFFARVMHSSMDSYEAGVGDYKRELFRKLDDSIEQVLELGIGTGPNLKYYGSKSGIQKVIGVDPNSQMAKFCSSAALNAGLSQSQFEFIHGVGEIIPLPDASVDAVVCTLVLCSVNNVSSTLKEVKRVLKPGGTFLFVEHVAAPEGNGLRLWQRILDPLQQLFADGCHLTRDTLQDIESAQFESVEANTFTVPGLFVIGPHIAGVAHTAHKDL